MPLKNVPTEFKEISYQMIVLFDSICRTSEIIFFTLPETFPPVFGRIIGFVQAGSDHTNNHVMPQWLSATRNSENGKSSWKRI